MLDKYQLTDNLEERFVFDTFQMIYSFSVSASIPHIRFCVYLVQLESIRVLPNTSLHLIKCLFSPLLLLNDKTACAVESLPAKKSNTVTFLSG